MACGGHHQDLFHVSCPLWLLEILSNAEWSHWLNIVSSVVRGSNRNTGHGS